MGLEWIGFDGIWILESWLPWFCKEIKHVEISEKYIEIIWKNMKELLDDLEISGAYLITVFGNIWTGSPCFASEMVHQCSPYAHQVSPLNHFEFQAKLRWSSLHGTDSIIQHSICRSSVQLSGKWPEASRTSVQCTNRWRTFQTISYAAASRAPPPRFWKRGLTADSSKYWKKWKILVDQIALNSHWLPWFTKLPVYKIKKHQYYFFKKAVICSL